MRQVRVAVFGLNTYGETDVEHFIIETECTDADKVRDAAERIMLEKKWEAPVAVTTGDPAGRKIIGLMNWNDAEVIKWNM